MFYTWGVSGCPTFICPCMFVCPLYIHMPPGVYTLPHMPHTFYASVWFWRFCMLWRVVMGSPLCWDTLLTFGGYLLLHPPHSVIVPCTLVCFRDISMLYGHFPSISKGLGGVSPIYWGVEGHQHLRCPYAHSCTFL